MPPSAVSAPAAAPAPREGGGDGFRLLRRGGCSVAAIGPLADAALRRGLLAPGGLGRWLASGVAGPPGRACTTRVALAGAGDLLVRPLRHGGLLGPLWRGRILGIGRALREADAARRLAALGAPVARFAILAGERRRGLWFAAIAYRYVPDAIDAAALLAADPGRPRMLRAAAAAGRALRRFHDLGGRHADLHAGNLLLRERESGCEALLVDLDRARAGAPPSASERLAEIARLHRSLEKRGLAQRVGVRGCAAFLAAYTGSDRVLRRALLRDLPRERRRTAVHRLGWRWLPGPSPR